MRSLMETQEPVYSWIAGQDGLPQGNVYRNGVPLSAGEREAYVAGLILAQAPKTREFSLGQCCCCAAVATGSLVSCGVGGAIVWAATNMIR